MACAVLVTFAAGQVHEAAARVLVMPENTIMASIIMWHERRVLEGILLFGVVGLVARSLMDFVDYRANFSLFLSDNLFSASSAAVVFSLGCHFFRRRDVRRARALVDADRVRYEELWSDMVSETHTYANLVRLRSLVVQVSLGRLK